MPGIRGSATNSWGTSLGRRPTTSRACQQTGWGSRHPEPGFHRLKGVIIALQGDMRLACAKATQGVLMMLRQGSVSEVSKLLPRSPTETTPNALLRSGLNADLLILNLVLDEDTLQLVTLGEALQPVDKLRWTSADHHAQTTTESRTAHWRWRA